MKKLIYCFDLDNVLCKTPASNYKKSKPIKRNINILSTLKKRGHYIKIFTARYMGRNNENAEIVKKKYYRKIYNQLKKWKINFDELIVGKPSYDYFIDDKCHNIKEKKTLMLIDRFIKKD